MFSIRDNYNSIKKFTFFNIISFFLTLCIFFLSFSCFKIFPNFEENNNSQYPNSYSNENNNINSSRNLDEKECSIKLLSNIELVSKDKFNEVEDKLILGKYIPKYLYEHSKIEDEKLKYYHSNNSNEETYTNSRLITKREVNIYILDNYIFKPIYTTFKSNAYNKDEESCNEGYKSCGYIKGGCKIKLLCVDENDDCPIKEYKSINFDSNKNTYIYNFDSYKKEDTLTVLLSHFKLLDESYNNDKKYEISFPLNQDIKYT